MKKILDFLNNYNLRTQIIIGFGMISCIFFFQALVVFISMQRILGTTSNAIQYGNNTALVLEIEKNISEIQREALVYTRSGKSNVIRKMERLSKKIDSDLASVKNNTIEKDKKYIIEKMQVVVNNYAENIKILEIRYKALNELLEKRLPNISDKGSEYLYGKIKANAKVVQDNLVYQNMLSDWLLIRLKINEFIAKREYKLKTEIKKLFDKIRKQAELDSSHDNFDQIINEYQELFNQAVQSNRIYLSLLNVVMAGDSVEFSSLAKELGELSIVSLNQTSYEAKEVIKKSQSFSILILILNPHNSDKIFS